jgi:hypothetical protein
MFIYLQNYLFYIYCDILIIYLFNMLFAIRYLLCIMIIIYSTCNMV